MYTGMPWYVKLKLTLLPLVPLTPSYVVNNRSLVTDPYCKISGSLAKSLDV